MKHLLRLIFTVLLTTLITTVSFNYMSESDSFSFFGGLLGLIAWICVLYRYVPIYVKEFLNGQ